MGIKVKATKLGYFKDKRVYEDEVIEVPEGQFSKKWMKKLSDGEPVKAAHKPAKISDKDRDVI